MLSNKVYDILKWVALVALDAIGLFYQTISVIWNLPYGDEILKTFAALSVFLGVLIGVDSIKYKNKNNASEEK